jgi:hypothetical protein
MGSPQINDDCNKLLKARALRGYLLRCSAHAKWSVPHENDRRGQSFASFIEINDSLALTIFVCRQSERPRALA